MKQTKMTVTLVLAAVVTSLPLACGRQQEGPRGSVGLAASSSALTLSWEDNANNETGFHVERRQGASGSWSQIGAPAENATQFVDGDVTAGVDYCYRVRAFNAAGNSAWSNEACATFTGEGGDGSIGGAADGAMGNDGGQPGTADAGPSVADGSGSGAADGSESGAADGSVARDSLSGGCCRVGPQPASTQWLGLACAAALLLGRRARRRRRR